jgi:hypothetical protein
MDVIKIKNTERGFGVGTFEDRYGAPCSIQESSIATESCIWLGVDDTNHGKFTDYGRMHLTQSDVAMMLPYLMHFVETGNLP